MKNRKSSPNSGLYAHAERELKLAGMFDKDSDYDGMLGESALELIDTFATQEHSGASAALTTRLFKKLAAYENLTPITADPMEWQDVSATMGGKKPVWQNKRNPKYFSEDGGKTYYCFEDMNRGVFGKILGIFGVRYVKKTKARVLGVQTKG